jgi:tetratricopeptide (TPR) repeat protein
VDEAIDDLQHALRIDPKSEPAHGNLSAALRAKGRLDEAIGHGQEAVRLEPKNVRARANLAYALHAKGRLDEAIDDLQHAVSIDPKFAGLHNNLAGALIDKGRLEEGVSHLRQAISIEPKSAALHHNLGIALRRQGRLKEAIDHLLQAVQLDGSKSTLFQTHLSHTLYLAACATVRTAAGQASENAQLGEPERARNRRQALDWLRASLEMTVKLRVGGKAEDWSLANWQTDPDVASVRDPAALASLPDSERAEWRRLWTDVAALLAADPLEQGRTRAGRREWAQAANAYSRALQGGPTDDGHFWFEYAALLLLSGDRLGYARARAHMIERCGKDGGPRSYHVARTCTLAAADAVADAVLPGRLAEQELQSSGGAFWSLTEQGALAYRAGRFQQAVPFFEQSLQADPKPGRAVVNWLWLALANQRLGQAEEARRWLDKAQPWLDQYRDGMPARAEDEFGLHFHNWLEAHVLCREAEALIQSEAPRNGGKTGKHGAPQK